MKHGVDEERKQKTRRLGVARCGESRLGLEAQWCESRRGGVRLGSLLWPEKIGGGVAWNRSEEARGRVSESKRGRASGGATLLWNRGQRRGEGVRATVKIGGSHGRRRNG